jgi:flagellar basal-body rod modification protein FlgD
MQINSLTSLAQQAASPTPAATSSTGTNSTSSSSNLGGGLSDPNLFITLLTAQLQAQDPLNPMSPEDMVSQLTEVSSLQQLYSINQTLTNIASGTTPPATTPSNPLG